MRNIAMLHTKYEMNGFVFFPFKKHYMHYIAYGVINFFIPSHKESRHIYSSYNPSLMRLAM